jgi:hypothetical protein
MRIIKRVSLFGMEVCILLFGLILTVALTEYFDSLFVIIAGLILTPAAFFATRRKTRKWKIEYDAESWIVSSRIAKISPNRAKRMRAIRRYLLWMPSAIAMFVLVFFPAATQLRYGHRLGNFNIPLPWTWTILKEYGGGGRYYTLEALISSVGVGRLGVNPFWSKNPSFSEVWFSSAPPHDAFELDRNRLERERAEGAQLSRRVVVLGDMPVTCWQYLRPDPAYPPLSGDWKVECEAPEGVGYHDFNAGVLGRQADIPEFYKTLQKVRPLD